MLPPAAQAPKAIRSIWPACAIILFAAVVLIVAQGYSETAARFPSIVAVVMLILGVIDLWSRTSLPGRAAIAAFWGTEFTRREMSHNPRLRDELSLVLWVLGCFAGMAVAGILPATPVFCILYVWLRGGKPIWLALTVGGIVFAFQFGVFEWLLDYDLYRGLLFSEGGLARW